MNPSRRQAAALTVWLALLPVASVAHGAVKLYGNLDLSLGKRTGGNWGLNEGSSFADSSKGNYLSSTTYGLRSEEDLGGGVMLRTRFESAAIDATTGGGGDGFTRQAAISITSPQWGSLKAGRAASTFGSILSHFNLSGATAGNSASRLSVNVLSVGGTFRSGLLEYATPRIQGYAARIGVVPAANKPDPNVEGSAKKTSWTTGVNYEQGPLALGIAYETKPYAYRERDAWGLGARYDFGTLKASVTYIRNFDRGVPLTSAADGRTGEGRGWNAELSIPNGPWTYGLNVAKNLDSRATAQEWLVTYRLSKQTRLYAAHSRVQHTAATTEPAIGGNTLVPGGVPANPHLTVFGLRTSF